MTLGALHTLKRRRELNSPVREPHPDLSPELHGPCEHPVALPVRLAVSAAANPLRPSGEVAFTLT